MKEFQLCKVIILCRLPGNTSVGHLIFGFLITRRCIIFQRTYWAGASAISGSTGSLEGGTGQCTQHPQCSHWDWSAQPGTVPTGIHRTAVDIAFNRKYQKIGWNCYRPAGAQMRCSRVTGEFLLVKSSLHAIRTLRALHQSACSPASTTVFIIINYNLALL